MTTLLIIIAVLLALAVFLLNRIVQYLHQVCLNQMAQVRNADERTSQLVDKVDKLTGRE